jgi:hypothetical protein
MKNTVPLFITVIACFLAISCVTGSGHGSWKSYPALPAYWHYQTGEILVTVDHVPEERIAAQLETIATSLLSPNRVEKIDAGFPAYIDIRVEQRSFLYEAKLYNTLYISCLTRDGEGNILGNEYEYATTGNRNIISPKEQYRLLKRVMPRIIRARQKRYREIRRYLRSQKRIQMRDGTTHE